MKVGIIAAMEEELSPLLMETHIEKELVRAKMHYYEGYLMKKDVVLVVSGIGKVNSAVCCQILLDEFNVDYIINVGVAGGAREEIKPLDIVIADNLLQHDMDTSVFGDQVGQVPRLDTYDFKCDEKLINIAMESAKSSNANTHVGRIISGDQFIADGAKILSLREKFNAYACEMEGGSIAQVCYLNVIPFVVIRSISDNATTGAHMDYDKFKTLAVKNSTVIIKNMLTLM